MMLNRKISMWTAWIAFRICVVVVMHTQRIMRERLLANFTNCILLFSVTTVFRNMCAHPIAERGNIITHVTRKCYGFKWPGIAMLLLNYIQLSEIAMEIIVKFHSSHWRLAYRIKTCVKLTHIIRLSLGAIASFSFWITGISNPKTLIGEVNNDDPANRKFIVASSKYLSQTKKPSLKDLDAIQNKRSEDFDGYIQNGFAMQYQDTSTDTSWINHSKYYWKYTSI